MLAPDGTAGGWFGRSVAIYGDTIVVGDRDDRGSAHVFVRCGENWTHQAKLRGVELDRFGGSVAIYGDTIVVGASSYNGGYSGSVHVFVRNGDNWSHQAKLLAPDGEAGDRFGNCVTIYEDTIVVGAYGDDDIGFGSGAVHVFVRSGEEWINQAKLLAPDGEASDSFGWNVAIYRDTIVVGVPWDDDNGYRSGSAHVFIRSGKNWTHQAKLLAPNGSSLDRFGASVTIYVDIIVVGAPWDDDNGSYSGSAHIFVQSGDDWTHEPKLLAPGGAKGEEFGESVAIYGDTIVIGAQWDDENGDESGSAHVFVRSGKGWAHQAKLLAPDGAASDYFGFSTAVYKDTIVVGAWGDDENGVDSGSAYVLATQEKCLENGTACHPKQRKAINQSSLLQHSLNKQWAYLSLQGPRANVCLVQLVASSWRSLSA